ncbi:hypothetical protein Q1695_002602 [Nippostrongylus brasiliensis]|nr:hypothetical protein Q1695_002602 [Nippostrongylus brasiliensis]
MRRHSSTVILSLTCVLLALSSDLQEKLTQSILKDFQIIDTDKDGQVSLDEVKEHWKEFVRKMNETQLDLMEKKYKEADLNKDGKINVTEFQDEVNRVLANPNYAKVHVGVFGSQSKMFGVGHIKRHP